MENTGLHLKPLNFQSKNELNVVYGFMRQIHCESNDDTYGGGGCSSCLSGSSSCGTPSSCNNNQFGPIGGCDIFCNNYSSTPPCSCGAGSTSIGCDPCQVNVYTTGCSTSCWSSSSSWDFGCSDFVPFGM